jgi:hypothetical protein
MRLRALTLTLALASSACSSAGESPAPDGPPPGPERCRAPEGKNPAPQTIEQATELLDALPKPTSVACFVESLARPLSIHATSSVVSLQPAASAQSPRVFIQFGRLYLSVVVDGEASHLIEFSYQLPDSELYSLKGELALPVDSAVLPSAPYDHVRSTVGTRCGSCHRGEYRLETITFAEAFASLGIRPFPFAHVGVETLRAEHAACDADTTPHRCRMLAAIFDGGPVNEASFPATWLTFF